MPTDSTGSWPLMFWQKRSPWVWPAMHCLFFSKDRFLERSSLSWWWWSLPWVDVTWYVRLYLWSFSILSFHPWNSQCILATLYKTRCWSHVMALRNCLLPTFDETKSPVMNIDDYFFCDTFLHFAAIFTRESSWLTGDICPDMFHLETMLPILSTRIGTKHRVLQYSTIHTGSLPWGQMGEWCVVGVKLKGW